MNFKKNGKVFTSKFVRTGPSSYKKKKIYRAAVSQRLRNTDIRHDHGGRGEGYWTLNIYSVQLLSVTFLILRRIQQDIIINVGVPVAARSKA